MASTPASEQIGTVLGGKYRLTRLLGEGGMGRVFAAEHAVLGKEVAVKVLLPQVADNAETAERFLREARAASAMDHPGIIKVMDADRDETGALYMVMELLEGESLGECILRTSPMSVEASVAIIQEVLAALQCAHDHQVVHRDLKPDNIFLKATGGAGSRVRILDFGISRMVGTDEESLRLTQTGTILGTPFYMAPEQARGLKNVDHRADLWAVGVILYEMLSGARPYQGDSYNAVMLAIAIEPVPSLAACTDGLPASLIDIVDTALAKEPGDRYATASEMAEALTAARIDGEVNIRATRTTPHAAAETDAISHASTMAANPEAVAPTMAANPEAVAPTMAANPEAVAPTMAARVDTPAPSPETITLHPGRGADQDVSEVSSAPSTASVASPSAPLRVGGFWRRTLALLVDFIIFSMVIGSLVDAVVPSSEVVDVTVTPEAVPEGADAPPSPPQTVSVSGVNITEEGVHIVGEGGDEIRIDSDGLRIRQANGEELVLGGGGDIAVDSTLATTLKVSLWILYCTLFLTLFGATPGKMVLRLRVAETGKPDDLPQLSAALVRSAFFILSLFALGLGCLWALGHRERLTWHDRIARTRVVHTAD